MSFLDCYEDLLAFLDHPVNRANIAEAMRYDFHTFVIIENLLIRKERVIEYSFLIEAINLLQRLADGKLQTNLALFWPPGWGKTQIMIYFCAWCLIRNPEVQFLYTNCVYSAVKQRGGEVLDIIKSNYTKKLFNIGISDAASSRTLFRLNESNSRSGFIGVAFEGGITGLDAGNPNIKSPKFTWEDKTPFRWEEEEAQEAGNSNPALPFGGGLWIDDPLSSSYTHSETRKETCRRIYNSTLVNRVRSQNCKKIAVFQRLAIDDLGATLKEDDRQGFDKWTFHEVQGYVNGKSTCERVKSTSYLATMSQMNSKREEFMAQFQQTPIVPSGEIIRPEWFKYHNNEFWEWHMLDMFITADTASGKDNSGCYTVFAVWSITTKGLCLIDLIRGKWNFPELRKQAIKLWEKWRCKRTEKGEIGWTKYGIGDKLSCLYIEDANSGTGLIQELQDMSNKSGNTLIVSELKTAGKDKVFRTQEVTPYIEAGYVWLPDNRPDITIDFVNECRNFTYDKQHEYDDQIDCLVYAIQKGIMKTRKYMFRLPMEFVEDFA